MPASMRLLGDWNWYLPRCLRWLPDVSSYSSAQLSWSSYSPFMMAPETQVELEVLMDSVSVVAAEGALDGAEAMLLTFSNRYV